VGADGEASAIEIDLLGPVAVGAVRAHAGERRERFGRGMTIPVPRAHGDQRRRRMDGRNERARVRRRRAVMWRHVDTRRERRGMQ